MWFRRTIVPRDVPLGELPRLVNRVPRARLRIPELLDLWPTRRPPAFACGCDRCLSCRTSGSRLLIVCPNEHISKCLRATRVWRYFPPPVGVVQERGKQGCRSDRYRREPADDESTPLWHRPEPTGRPHDRARVRPRQDAFESLLKLTTTKGYSLGDIVQVRPEPARHRGGGLERAGVPASPVPGG